MGAIAVPQRQWKLKVGDHLQGPGDEMGSKAEMRCMYTREFGEREYERCEVFV